MCAATNSSSMPFIPSSAFSAPTRNARSPPVWTGNQCVGESRAEDRALGDRRHPVPLEARFAHRIDDGDLGAALLGVMEVLRRDGLVVRRVRPEEHDEVGAEPVDVAARRRAVAERRLHRDGRGRVTEPRGVVDVRAAVRARHLLRDVVDLVRDAAGRQVERRARRIDGAEPGSRDVNRLVPRDRPETPVAARAARAARAAGRALAGRRSRASASEPTSPRRSTSSAGAVFSRSSSSRTMHRCVPLIVQSDSPAVPSAQPSQHPWLRMRQANGSSSRFSHAMRRMSR